MSTRYATYEPEANGLFPAVLLLVVLVLTALGIVAHAAFV